MMKLFLYLFIAALWIAFLPQAVSAQTVTIKITKDGFTPDTVTIDKGESVAFENVDDMPHWPASDLHPSHGVYPEFDPKAELPPGSSWLFTFEKPGSWSMHDHLNPSFMGTVVVSGEVEPEKVSLIETIKNKIDKFLLKHLEGYRQRKFEKIDIYELTSQKEELKTWISLMGADTMVEKLLTESGSGATRDCHQEAHLLGQATFEVNGKDAFSMEYGANCHSGFYHGAMEGFLAKEGVENLSENIKTICDSFETSFSQFECLHGVGHGVMVFTNYDMPRAIEYCDLLVDGFARVSCYGGMFMENIVAAQGHGANSSHQTAWLSRDPHFPCNTVGDTEEVLYQCYQMQTSWMMSLFSSDYEKIAAECLNSVDGMVPVCFRSFGRDIAGNTLRDPIKIVEFCRHSGDYFDNCIEGGLNVIVDFWGDRMEGYPHELCENVVEPASKLFCYQSLNSRLAGIYGDNTEAIQRSCDLFEPEYQEVCYLTQ